MVRDMKLVLKEFLTISEVCDYLKARGYDLSNDDNECYAQVKSILLDLSRERGLKVLFYYCGKAYIYKEGNKDRKPINEKIVLFKGYVMHEHLTYFLDNKGKEWKSYKGDFEFPRYFQPFHSKNVTFLTSIDLDNEIKDLIYLDLLQLQNIKPCDLRISLTELKEILENIEKFNNNELSQQVADQQATIDQQAKEIADLKAQLEQQANQPCETVLDDEMETKSLNAVSRLVYVLLDMAEYDLSTHSGNGNTSIIARSEKLLQKPLSKKFVSDWIKNAQTAKIEYGKK